MGNKFYNFTWIVLKPLFNILHPFSKVTGAENLPEGSFVICLNHCSALDPLYVATKLPIRKRIYYLGKKELFDNAFLRPLVTWLGGIPVDRGHADLSAIRTAMTYLKEGKPIGIFPQGTRSRDNTPTPMLTGASMIALRGNVPVIPAYIDAPYRPFHRVNLTFGKPLDFSDFGRSCNAETLNEATKRIENGIWSLRGEKV